MRIFLGLPVLSSQRSRISECTVISVPLTMTTFPSSFRFGNLAVACGIKSKTIVSSLVTERYFHFVRYWISLLCSPSSLRYRQVLPFSTATFSGWALCFNFLGRPACALPAFIFSSSLFVGQEVFCMPSFSFAYSVPSQESLMMALNDFLSLLRTTSHQLCFLFFRNSHRVCVLRTAGA